MTILGIAKVAAICMLLSSWPLVALPQEAETPPDDCVSLMQHQFMMLPKEVASTSSRSSTAPGCNTEPCVAATALGNSGIAEAEAEADSTILSLEQFRVIQSASSDVFNWPAHIFGHPKERHSAGMWALHDRYDWLALATFVVAMILSDIYVIRPWFERTSLTGLHRTGPVVLCWISAAMLFNIYIGARHGHEDALRWMNGYLLEWMLSMDNIFVFHLVFKLYKTPAALQPKALFWGVFGAILFRMLFFVALNSLLEVMHLCRYFFGLFLVYSGIQAVRADDDDEDLASSWPVRFLNWLLQDRLLPAPHYEMQGRLWVNAKNKETGDSMVRISMLVPVIACLELTDVLFAVDSVSAKVGQIPDQFLAYSSSLFAMFGLRSLFFIMEDLVERIRFLKYGLCFILVFIGVELILADFVELPATLVCIVLVVVFLVCGILSFIVPEPEEESLAVEDKKGNEGN